MFIFFIFHSTMRYTVGSKKIVRSKKEKYVQLLIQAMKDKVDNLEKENNCLREYLCKTSIDAAQDTIQLYPDTEFLKQLHLSSSRHNSDYQPHLTTERLSSLCGSFCFISQNFKILYSSPLMNQNLGYDCIVGRDFASLFGFSQEKIVRIFIVF